MYLVCTGYVLSMYWYVLGKTKKRMLIMLGLEPWISSIASCALYSYATRVHSMVLSLVNSRYIYNQFYTGITQYLWLVQDVLRGSRRDPRPAPAMTSLVRT